MLGCTIFQQEDKKILMVALSRQAHGPESRRIFPAREWKLDRHIAETSTGRDRVSCREFTRQTV